MIPNKPRALWAQFSLVLSFLLSSSAFAGLCVSTASELPKSQSVPGFMYKLPAYFVTGDKGGVAFTLQVVNNQYRGIFFAHRPLIGGFVRGELYAKNVCFNGNSLVINLMDGKSFSGVIADNTFVASTALGEVKMWASDKNYFAGVLNSLGVPDYQRGPTR